MIAVHKMNLMNASFATWLRHLQSTQPHGKFIVFLNHFTEVDIKLLYGQIIAQLETIVQFGLVWSPTSTQACYLLTKKKKTHTILFLLSKMILKYMYSLDGLSVSIDSPTTLRHGLSYNFCDRFPCNRD